jgi:uncharacterized protein
MIPTNSDLSLSEQPPGVSPVPLPHYSPRIQSLDVLRGIAVLGALFVSIWIFGGFSSNQQSGLLIKSKGFDYRLFGTVDLLFEGKMRALIGFVFGAGMLLFLSKDNQRNVSNQELFIRRHMWLILFGIINGILLLWTNDLLFHLGVMGILLFPFVRLQTRGLLIAAILITFIYSGKSYWNFSDHQKAYNKYLAVTTLEKKIAKDSVAHAQKKVAGKEQKKDTLTKQQKEEKSAWEGIVAGMKYDSKKDDGENKAMRSGSYGKIYNHLLTRTQAREASWTYTTGIWDLAGMILLGMALFKMGFFTNRLSKNKYLLLAVVGLAAGLLLGWFRLHNNQVALQDYTKFVQSHWMPYNLFFPFERAFMALGYASLVLVLINSGALKYIWKAFSAAGRMALTNYLLQTVSCTLFFAGFGMGYFGRLQQYQLYLMAAELCLVQAVFSVLWLRYFRYGPAEWLWRCLIYRKWLPNKIDQTETKESPVPLFS